MGIDADMGFAQVLLDQEDVSHGVAPLGVQGTVTYSYTVVNVAELRLLASMDEKAALADGLASEKAALESTLAGLHADLAASQATVAELESAFAEDGDADAARA